MMPDQRRKALKRWRAKGLQKTKNDMEVQAPLCRHGLLVSRTREYHARGAVEGYCSQNLQTWGVPHGNFITAQGRPCVQLHPFPPWPA